MRTFRFATATHDDGGNRSSTMHQPETHGGQN
jgi:hypothetical protein